MKVQSQSIGSTALNGLFAVLFVAVCALCLVPGVAWAGYQEDFDAQKAKEEAASAGADHIIGADVENDPYILVQPGETVGIKLKMSLGEDKYGWTLGYDVWSLNDAVVDATYLHDSTTPNQTKLTQVYDPRTVSIPSGSFGTAKTSSGISAFTYTHLYRNDTGLPLVLCTEKMKSTTNNQGRWTYAREGAGGDLRVDAKVNYYAGAKLYAVEKSYPIEVTAADKANTYSSSVTTYPLGSLYWPNGTPSFPESYVVDGAVHTYTLPNPVRKGAVFQGWNATYTDDYDTWYQGWFGLYQAQYVGKVVSDGNTSDGPAAKIVRNAEDTVITVDMTTYMNFYRSSSAKYLGIDKITRDIHFNAQFSNSSYAHTVGFNPEGGTVNGKSYGMMEVATYLEKGGTTNTLDIGTVVPVRSGYTFKGWCTDKSNPSGTLITDTSPDNADNWRDSSRHTELYAVWQANASVAVTGVKLNKTSTTITVGKTETLTATVSPTNATNKKVTWKSSDTAVATVDANGKVTAKKAGTATITVTTESGAKTATCKVTVNSSTPAVTTKVPMTKATITGIANKTYTGKALTQAPVVKLDGKTLKAGTDYTLSYANNTKVGTATLTITGKGNYSGSVKKTFKIVKNATWTRLQGPYALDTMKAITKRFGTASTAVVATNADFKDSLAAAALAGSLNAPMLTSDPNNLSSQTSAELKRMGVTKVYIVGSTSDVKEKVRKQILALPKVKSVQRVSGNNPAAKAIAASKAMGSNRSNTVIIATQKSFKDALSISSYAYATKTPILYAENNLKLSNATISYIKSAKFSRAIIVGSVIALPASLDSQLVSAGIPRGSITRLAGQNACNTSRVIAEWAMGKLKNGTGGGNGFYRYTYTKFQPEIVMGINNLGISRTDNWKDALAGAALCGKNRAIILLADQSNTTNTTVISRYKYNILQGYVFGSNKAVSDSAYKKIVNASK